MSSSADAARPVEKKKGCPCSCLGLFVATAALWLLAYIGFGPVVVTVEKAPESAAIQQTRQIGLLLFSYAADHNQNYPDGKNSTEVFQKLLDEQYCTDPAVFYVPLAGKSVAHPGEKLKPENVCFDVTGGVGPNSSDQLPVVFTTGYRMNYVPGGDAVHIKGLPQFNDRIPDNPSPWWSWSRHGRKSGDVPGIVVCNKGNATVFRKLGSYWEPSGFGGYHLQVDDKAVASGIIPKFISPDYKPDGTTYRQLTPDGVLP